MRLIVGESEGYARRDLAGIAINSLGQIDDATSAEVLCEVVSHKHEYGWLVDAAAKALTEMDSPVAIKAQLTLAKNNIYGERAVKALTQLLERHVVSVPTDTLSLVAKVTEIRQAKWDDSEPEDVGWSSVSHVVDTAGLIGLAKRELEQRAAQAKAL